MNPLHKPIKQPPLLLAAIAITACILIASTLGAIDIVNDIRKDTFISTVIVLAWEAVMLMSVYGIYVIMQQEIPEETNLSWLEKLLGVTIVSQRRKRAGIFYAMNAWGVSVMMLVNSLEGWKKLKDPNVIAHIADDTFGAWALIFIGFASMTPSLWVLYEFIVKGIWKDTAKKGEKNVGFATLSGRGMGFRDDEWRELEARGLDSAIKELYYNAPTKEAKQAVTDLYRNIANKKDNN